MKQFTKKTIHQLLPHEALTRGALTRLVAWFAADEALTFLVSLLCELFVPLELHVEQLLRNRHSVRGGETRARLA